jgi:aryl-alcohol dehydrogenase-like predicted oxidoreductase
MIESFKIETGPLAPGVTTARVIKGGWQLHEAAEELERGSAAWADAVAELHRFADAGITTFETADSYRGVDAIIAACLAERRARNATPPVRVHTRLTLGPDSPTRAAMRGQLEWARARIGQRLDLVQLASWRHGDDDLRAAWGWLVEAAPGTAHHLGLMNLDAERIAAIGRGLVAPLTVQVPLSLVDRRAERTLLPYCREHAIAVLAYGTLAGGFLSARWLGRPDPGLTPSAAAPFHREYRLVIEAAGGWAAYQRLLAALAAIGTRHKVDPGTIATRWVLDQPGVAAVLVGASSAARIADLAALARVRLDASERATLAELALPGPPGAVGVFERDPDGPMARAIASRT